MDMLPHGQQRQIECHIPNARIAAEDRIQCYQQSGHEQRLPSKLECQWHQVEDQGVELERVQEEDAEVIEHFREEVPEETDVGLQITVTQTARKE